MSESNVFEVALTSATKLPLVNVNRETFLRNELSMHCSQEQIKQAIEGNTALAGIPIELLDKLAESSITYETRKVSAISAVAGIPGGFGMIGTIPADMAQFLAHQLRIIQKLAYLYGWKDLDVDKNLDAETQNVLILFMGLMAGVSGANMAVKELSKQLAGRVLKELPKQALTKGMIYPVVKEIAKFFGVKMTKATFGQAVGKAIPFFGGVISGTITYVSFKPLARNLKKELREIHLSSPKAD